uniref:exodeoxyribonuclease III n=1 Tax=Stegastes partitus TaxID=144197 RepID=A0A3B4Z9Q3_9TELE
MSSQIGLIRLSTWNVNGLGNPIKRKKVMTMLKNKNHDVVFLQETHMSKEESEKLCVGWVGHVFYSIGSSKSKGVIILVSKQLQFKCIRQIKDNSGRVIIVLAEIQSQKLILANIYAPNLDDQHFFVDLERKLQTAGNHTVVLGGDFNLLMDPALDHSGAVLRNVPKAAVTLQRICKSLGLIDIWRIMNPSGRDYTFFSPVHKTYSRIDFFLISKALTSSAVNCEIGNILISDHAWVSLDLLPQSERRKSYRWRLNSSLLQDPVNVAWLRTEINNYLEINWKSVSSAGVAWEALKAVIRGRIIQHTSYQKKIRTQELLELENRIKQAETELKQQMTQDGMRKLTKLKYQYNNIITQKVEFNLFRARQTYFESGDKAGKLL